MPPDQVNDKLDAILTQAQLTNGRVSTLEVDAQNAKRVLWGDPADPTDTGLVGMRSDVQRVIVGFDRMTKVVTRVGLAIVTAGMSVAGALIFGGG